ncbi:MAG: hypothetical protein KJ060_20285, partial [Candidatus Hydrogenedentes bacterium]|nr:hypothetical protein [Candidatus Hydrogenedentota bacterium]
MQLRDKVVELESQLTGTRAEFEALSAERDRAADSETALSEATAELEQARDELDQLRASAEKVGAAERLLEAERQRANELEERLRAETAHGTKAIIAQQLADALRDGEAAREEAASLRVELQNLRREAEERAAEMERVTTPKRPKLGRDVQKRQLG